MKKVSTNFMRIVLLFFGIISLVLCLFSIPWFYHGLSDFLPELFLLKYLFIFGMSFPIVPFLFALYQALKLLSYIDQNKAFSNHSISTLKNIKNSALSISILYAICLPTVYTTNA